MVGNRNRVFGKYRVNEIIELYEIIRKRMEIRVLRNVWFNESNCGKIVGIESILEKIRVWICNEGKKDFKLV